MKELILNDLKNVQKAINNLVDGIEAYDGEMTENFDITESPLAPALVEAVNRVTATAQLLVPARPEEVSLVAAELEGSTSEHAEQIRKEFLETAPPEMPLSDVIERASKRNAELVEQGIPVLLLFI